MSTTNYHSVSELCVQLKLKPSQLIYLILNENLTVSIYISNLKTYYFDFVLRDCKIDICDVHSCFISGLFHLTPYETQKILKKGKGSVSCVKPQDDAYITLAHPYPISIDDLLIDTQGLSQVNQAISLQENNQRLSC